MIPLLFVGLPAFLIVWFLLGQVAGVSIWLLIVRWTIGPFSLPTWFHRRS